MAVQYVAHGGPTTSVNGGSSVNVIKPAALAGDIIVLFTTCTVGLVAAPSGWTELASDNTVSGTSAQIWWKAVTADESAGSVTITHSPGISRGTTVVVRGASTDQPSSSEATISNSPTALAPVTGATTEFGTFALFCVVANPSPRIRDQASAGGRWTPTEQFDSILGGVRSMSLTTGPMTGSGPDQLLGRIDAAPWAAMSVALFEPGGGGDPEPSPLPLSVGATPIDDLRVGAAPVDAVYLGSTLLWP